ncbi:uncharacterized protein DS421_7g200300 [Arachis hypogaea]|nr:uncharacterized protein DS421_7g200300 [Arachis hypogaea]
MLTRNLQEADDEVIAEVIAAAANISDAVDVGVDGHNGNTTSNDGHVVANNIENDAGNNANNDTAASEVEITQPSYSQPLINEVVAPLVPIQPTRPNKLPPKRRSQHSTAANIDPMQGASSGTATRLTGVMRFVLTPDFIPPKKK